MKQYIVDAFTDEVFHGNQAAICIMDQWPSEELMMNITGVRTKTWTSTMTRRRFAHVFL
ncbi:MAG: hypothetical protein ACOX8M_13440 [Marvinbryantia sp.]|jgi:predicted PhzF superfamily epimerase YddE/YHI9